MIKIYILLLIVCINSEVILHQQPGRSVSYVNKGTIAASGGCKITYSPDYYWINIKYENPETCQKVFVGTRKCWHEKDYKLCTYTLPMEDKIEINRLTSGQINTYSLLEEIYRGLTALPKCKHNLYNLPEYKCLENEIQKLYNLKYLFVDDPDVSYSCSKNITCKKFNHLQKCVIQTAKYNFLEKYIDLYLDEYPEVINYQNENGWTALMLAARNSNHTSTDKTVEILLKHGADVNIQDHSSNTASILSSNNFQGDSSVRTIELLLRYKANVNIQDFNGFTALMFATFDTQSEKSKKVISLLLDHHADVNIHNKDYDTAFTLAIKNSRVYERDHIKMLIKRMDRDIIEKENNKIVNYALEKCGIFAEHNLIEKDVVKTYYEIIKDNHGIREDNHGIREDNHEIIEDNNGIIEVNNGIIKDNHEIIEDNHEIIEDNHEIIEDNHEIIEDNHEIIEDNHEIIEDNHEIIEDNHEKNFTYVKLPEKIKINPNEKNEKSPSNKLITILLLIYIFSIFYYFIKIFLSRIKK